MIVKAYAKENTVAKVVRVRTNQYTYKSKFEYTAPGDQGIHWFKLTHDSYWQTSLQAAKMDGQDLGV